MNVVIFVYTIALILICFAAAMLSVAAYAVSHRLSLIPQATFFAFYIVDICSIFGIEFLNQNIPYSAENYYAIPVPLLRILSGVGVMASLWIMLLDILDVHNRRMQVIPVGIFVLACCAVIWGLPYSPLRQWLFYTLRQVFIAFGLTFAFVKWRRSSDMPYRERLGKQRKRYLLLWLLLAGILLEDLWVILLAPIPSEDSSLALLCLSERNFSENAMMLFVAYHVIRGSLETLTCALTSLLPPRKLAAMTLRVISRTCCPAMPRLTASLHASARYSPWSLRARTTAPLPRSFSCQKAPSKRTCITSWSRPTRARATS